MSSSTQAAIAAGFEALADVAHEDRSPDDVQVQTIERFLDALDSLLPRDESPPMVFTRDWAVDERAGLRVAVEAWRAGDSGTALHVAARQLLEQLPTANSPDEL